MATHSSITELRTLQVDDLKREIQAKRMTLAKMRLGLTMRSEKDSAMFRRERKGLAQMLTVLNAKTAQTPVMAKEKVSKKTPLKTKAKASKVSAPHVSSSRRGAPTSSL